MQMILIPTSRMRPTKKMKTPALPNPVRSLARGPHSVENPRPRSAPSPARNPLPLATSPRIARGCEYSDQQQPEQRKIIAFRRSDGSTWTGSIALRWQFHRICGCGAGCPARLSPNALTPSARTPNGPKHNVTNMTAMTTRQPRHPRVVASLAV